MLRFRKFRLDIGCVYIPSRSAYLGYLLSLFLYLVITLQSLIAIFHRHCFNFLGLRCLQTEELHVFKRENAYFWVTSIGWQP